VISTRAVQVVSVLSSITRELEAVEFYSSVGARLLAADASAIAVKRALRVMRAAGMSDQEMAALGRTLAMFAGAP